MLPTPLPIQVFDIVTSTNDTILEAGTQGAPEGTTHIARQQTQGRGRGGHVWWSPPGAGLWMSTLLRPRAQRSTWTGISLIAGEAARQALARLGVQAVEVLWPNDLMVGTRKLGGILSEVRGQRGESWIALGIGVNIDLTSEEVRTRMPQDLRGKVTSMVECGHPTTTRPEEIAVAILNEFRPLYTRFLAGEKVGQLVGKDLVRPGEEVAIVLDNARPRRAIVMGLSETGELVVRDREGRLESLVAGEVRYDHGR